MHARIIIDGILLDEAFKLATINATMLVAGSPYESRAAATESCVETPGGNWLSLLPPEANRLVAA